MTKNKPISRLCGTFLDFNVSNSRAIAIGDAAGYDKADYKLSTFKDLLDIVK